MKKKFIESSLDLIKSKKEVDNLEEKRLRYGLEGFYNTYTKFMVMLILSLILGIWRGTKISSKFPYSIKPYPFVLLNHFTVPLSIICHHSLSILLYA